MTGRPRYASRNVWRIFFVSTTTAAVLRYVYILVLYSIALLLLLLLWGGQQSAHNTDTDLGCAYCVRLYGCTTIIVHGSFRVMKQ